MNTFSWWEAGPRDLLEQGDIIETNLQLQPVVPVKFLAKGSTGKGGRASWDESDIPPVSESDSTRLLASIVGTHGIVLSYGCEIDKLKPAQTVLIAPISLLETLKPDLQEQVIKQEVHRYFPLVNIPNLGNFYANLGKTFSLQRRLIQPHHRLVSMNDEARVRLQAQIVAFYTRLKLPEK